MIMNIPATLATEFYISRYLENLAFPTLGSTSSLSLIIREGTTNPAMQPIGIAKVPKAVESALSLSPNHSLANLLVLFPKKT